ncbi:hypothetical protein BJ165DRAFT_1357574 [Panaeolus papilionaceus]|nr:hypothetical protein BJ165DRAFT_1357574 [Panaeolus papilionaceus]
MLPGKLAGPSTPLRSHVLRCKGFRSSIRTFSRTYSRKEDDHYQTLGVHHTASKSQIKVCVLQLSKVHHPDVSHNPESKALFTKASAAYTILINDRDRRAYDRSLLHRSPPPQTASNPFNTRAPPTRQARAGYAWETRSRGAGRRPAADLGYAPKPGKSPYTSSRATPGHGRHYDPSPSSRSPLSGAQRRMEENDRQLDKIRNESMVLRAVQLVGFLVLSIGMIKGFGT